jgi:hypothetical protein
MHTSSSNPRLVAQDVFVQTREQEEEEEKNAKNVISINQGQCCNKS